jgi:hypothetical protein
LNEDAQGNPATAMTAQQYAQILGLSGYPVTADATSQIYQKTFWNGSPRPGKCALAPNMTIVHCWVGADDTEGLDAIRAHAGM